MQHALLNRFQATLLGAVLGEAIGLQHQKNPSLKLGSVSKEPVPKLQWAPLTYFYAQQLIQHNRFEIADLFKEQIPQTTAEAMIALLPVALFSHEDRSKLWQNLEHPAILGNSKLDPLELFAVGCTIAAALQETLDPLTLIPAVSTHLKSLSGDEETAIQQLQRVQRLLNEQAGLETAVTLLTSQTINPEIGLALYCFLSTPHDLRLALMRSAQTGARSAVICAITGALSGAFNSMSGIPIEWQLALDSWVTPSQEVITQFELLELANRLLASWSGVYDPLTFSKEFGQLLPAIAAPQVIRKAM